MNRRTGPPTSTLQVSLEAPAQDLRLRSFATGLSVEGCFVRASRGLPVGTEVLVALHPNGESTRITTRGRVVSVEQSGPLRYMELAFECAGDEAAQIVQLMEELDRRA